MARISSASSARCSLCTGHAGQCAGRLLPPRGERWNRRVSCRRAPLESLQHPPGDICGFFFAGRGWCKWSLQMLSSRATSVPLSYIPSPEMGLFFILFYFFEAGLQLVILLTHPPECWDYRCEPPAHGFIRSCIHSFSISIPVTWAKYCCGCRTREYSYEQN